MLQVTSQLSRLMSEQTRTRCRAGSQGASGKRANGDFLCRAWKIVIGHFGHLAEFGSYTQSRELSELRKSIKFHLYIEQSIKHQLTQPSYPILL